MFNKKINERVDIVCQSLNNLSSMFDRWHHRTDEDINLVERRCAELEKRLAELYIFLGVHRVHTAAKTTLEKKN